MVDSRVRIDINVRSDRYFIARTDGVCWRCRKPTRLFALALPPGHKALQLDDEAQDENHESRWSVAAHNAFLFYIEYLSAAVQRRLKGLPSFRFGRSEAAAGPYWANHCKRCGFLLDDHELFCEPEGAFLPTDETSAGIIHLLAIEEVIEATAAGYAYEPQFFDAMRRRRSPWLFTS